MRKLHKKKKMRVFFFSHQVKEMCRRELEKAEEEDRVKQNIISEYKTVRMQ